MYDANPRQSAELGGLGVSHRQWPRCYMEACFLHVWENIMRIFFFVTLQLMLPFQSQLFISQSWVTVTLCFHLFGHIANQATQVLFFFSLEFHYLWKTFLSVTACKRRLSCASFHPHPLSLTTGQTWQWWCPLYSNSSVLSENFGSVLERKWNPATSRSSLIWDQLRGRSL